MKGANTLSRARKRTVLGLERALCKHAAKLNAEERLSLATVYERWARQLRFSVEIQTPLKTTLLERMPYTEDWAKASIVSARIEQQLTPPVAKRDCSAPSTFCN